MNEYNEILSNKNKKVIGKFEIESLRNIWLDEFICVRNKMYAFKCGDDSKSELKGFSKKQPRNFNFEEKYNCLFVNKNVIIIVFDHLTKKCIFNE